MLVEKARYIYIGRVVKGAPYVFARACPNRKTVRVMDFWAPIDRRRLDGFGVPIHRCEGSEAQPLHRLPEEQGLLDIHDHARGALNHEAEGPGNAWSIQQRI